MGGGLGYNYNPPIGNEEGSPTHSNSFAVKAMLGIGNSPKGMIFAGRMEMALMAGQFSLYGKTWLLNQKDALFGEGQLNLYWQPQSKMDGYVRMFIGIPNAEGKIFNLDGKINFMYSQRYKYIKSEKITGSFLSVLKADANIDITTDYLKMNGSLGYGLNKEFSLGIVTAIIDFNVNASAGFQYLIQEKSLDTYGKFNGYWDFNLDTPLGNADITSGSFYLGLDLHADPKIVEVKGEASISYSVWFYSGSKKLNVGYVYNF
jgi:hypothetical protein